ncbi:MAG: hypothetical protein NTV93_12515 [Verrucomicrobia bacterium]|nr:hypothetical protein [Verrucomicrobiota bacterium]
MDASNEAGFVLTAQYLAKKNVISSGDFDRPPTVPVYSVMISVSSEGATGMVSDAVTLAI